MSMRRPRIKPVANILLNSKRKPKPAHDAKPGDLGENNGNNLEGRNKDLKVVIPSHEKEASSNVANLLEVRTESTYDTNASGANLNNDKGNYENSSNGSVDLQIVKTKAEESTIPICESGQRFLEVTNSTKNTNEFSSKKVLTEVKESINDCEAFKFPPKVEFQKAITHTSNSGLDDVFYSDIEENALQMDLEKSPNCPMSPSKNMARPRIRPTPHFGQRRNSYVGSSPSPHTSASEDNPSSNNIVNNDVIQPSQTKRERHHSASISGNSHSSMHHHTPHKYLPTGITNSSLGRVRTESGCSVFSDNSPSYKLRKIDEHKQTARKDYQARFHNGVPEKSVIKMSDLIFYNPATNPMELKSVPNVKLEQNETSIDTKPFIGKSDTDTNIPTDDTEAVPVPQLKLNAKGELILDDKSLVIETTAEQEARKALANSSLIYLDEYTGMNGFYTRKSRTRAWLPTDTIKFYRCLQNIGTDFSLMVSLFPNRTRRDLRLKFKKEERKNGHLINKALLYPKQFDLEALKQQMDEEEKLREEQVEEIKKKPKNKKKKINCQSKAARALLNTVYQNENGQIENNTDKSDDVLKMGIPAHIDPVKIDKSEKIEHKDTEKEIKLEKSKKISKKLTEPEKLIMESEHKARHGRYANKQLRKLQHRRKLMKNALNALKEGIKIEHKQENNENEFQDTAQLEMELDDLLSNDAQCDSDTYETTKSDILSNTYQTGQYNEQINATAPDMSNAASFAANIIIENNVETEKYEHNTIVNSDDGSLSVYSKIKDDIIFISPHDSTTLSPAENENNSFELLRTEPEIMNNDNCSPVATEPELNEADIQSILTELAEGSLVLVSSLDPEDPDKVLNEIYMVDKNTGDLCEEPLSIPDNIVQCILTVAS